jgi:4-hydroxybenzoate polyprenyltransferase
MSDFAAQAAKSFLPALSSLRRRLTLTLSMIKFQHTLFALPFALLSAFLAAQADGRLPAAAEFFWILLACVFARSAAMTFNRLHDEPFDRRNPRTRDWPLAAGLLSRGFAWTFCAICIAGFVFSAAMLNRLALALSPVALAVLLGYSLTKRFTAWTHFFLGLALAIAPIGAWVAIRAEVFAAPPLLLALAVLLWTAGFDIIYSLQDSEFDREVGLHSLPVRLGRRRALAVSALCHALALTAFLAVGLLTGLGTFFFIALAGCAWLLAYEQRIVSPTDLSRLGRAFFTVNGWVSLLMFAGALLDILRRV